MKQLATLIISLFIASGVLAGTPVTVVFNVEPPMSCQNCENKIKSNIRFEKGVKKIETSLQDQTVAITYDPAKNTSEKLSDALKKIGYQATATKAYGKCNAEKGNCCNESGNKNGHACSGKKSCSKQHGCEK